MNENIRLTLARWLLPKGYQIALPGWKVVKADTPPLPKGFHLHRNPRRKVPLLEVKESTHAI